MIVKTISHTSPKVSIMQKLIDYVFAPEKLIDPNGKFQPLILKKYVRGYDHSKWGQQFKTNDDKRNFEHKKRTVLRHEVLSFSPESHPYITREKLQHIAKEYVNIRSPKSLAVAGVHYAESNKNTHIHFVFSGVGTDGYSTRITRGEFSKIKQHIQSFQMEQYPELSHSIVEHTSKKKERASRKKNN